MGDRLEGVHKLLESFCVLLFPSGKMIRGLPLWESDFSWVYRNWEVKVKLGKEQNLELVASVTFNWFLGGGGEKGEDEKPWGSLWGGSVRKS